ncbi:hypothetical protein FB45DRAFT_935761 [Roridomyces roridus]|uniref:Uncharacterized protein n=1 Tax=Roridomyces roridus TaxID=1738132 RepID=A0AAD7BAM9_9AGAR|nr:hypothetical protein FB45DRAFT_935761 [Roridomyces roridus]
MHRSLRSPSMQSITLEDCRVPASVLSHAAAFVSRLRLSDVELEVNPEPAFTHLPKARANLKELSYLSGPTEDSESRVALALLPHLGALTKYEDDLTSMTTFKLVVGATRETLEHLQLRQISLRCLQLLASIPHRPRMESLRFLGIDLRADVLSKLSLTSIFSALPKPSEVPHLETFSLLIAPAEMLLPVPKANLPVDWEAYEYLRNISVNLRWSNQEIDDEVVEYIRRQHLPSQIRMCVSNGVYDSEDSGGCVIL